VVIGFSRIMDGEKVFQEVKFKDEITIELQRVEGRLQSIDHVDYGATCGMSGIVECVIRSGACIEMREREDRHYPQSSEILDALKLSEMRSIGTMDVMEMGEAVDYYRKMSYRYAYEKHRVVKQAELCVEPLTYGAMWLNEGQSVEQVWRDLTQKQLTALTNNLTPIVDVRIREPNDQILVRRGEVKKIIMVLISSGYVMISKDTEELPSCSPCNLKGQMLVKGFLEKLCLAPVKTYHRFEVGRIMFYVVEDQKKTWVKGLSAKGTWKFVDENYLKLRAVQFLELVQKMLKSVRKFGYKRRKSEVAHRRHVREKPGMREGIHEHPGPEYVDRYEMMDRVEVIGALRDQMEDAGTKIPERVLHNFQAVDDLIQQRITPACFMAETELLYRIIVLGGIVSSCRPGMKEGVEENPGPKVTHDPETCECGMCVAARMHVPGDIKKRKKCNTDEWNKSATGAACRKKRELPKGVVGLFAQVHAKDRT